MLSNFVAFDLLTVMVSIFLDTARKFHHLGKDRGSWMDVLWTGQNYKYFASLLA